MFKLLAIAFAAALCFLGASAKAESFSAQDQKQIKEALQGAQPFSKGEIDGSIDRLVKQGVISASEAAQAKEKLHGMSADDVKKLQEQASKLLN